MANAAKEYLRQAYNIKCDIDSKKQQLEVLRSIAEGATGAYEALRVSGTDSRSKMETAIIKMQALEQKIAKSTAELTKQYAGIAAVIEAVDEPTYRVLLAYRYLGFKTWDEIADLMGYSREGKHIFKLHGRALQSVKLNT